MLKPEDISKLIQDDCGSERKPPTRAEVKATIQKSEEILMQFVPISDERG